MILRKIIVAVSFFVLLSVHTFAFDTLRISATLDTSLHQVIGVSEYRLPAGSQLSNYEFQLYPNVYSSEDSPYLAGEVSLRRVYKESKKWGGMTIDSALVNGINQSDRIEVDYTRGVLHLDEFPSDSPPTIKLYFTTTLPERGDRLFYLGQHYLLGGWYPCPTLLRDGEWVHPHYGKFAELAGDYYMYDVEFTAPPGYTVAGPYVSDSLNSGNADSLHNFKFGPAHDIALAIDPNYLIDKSTAGETSVRIYYRDYEFPILPKLREAISRTIEYMNRYVGKYEYAGINFALSDMGFLGGIEYPGLVVMSSPRGSSSLSNFFEMTAVHEVIHQWFYGMIGSDQIESPWMDEAITNFFTYKVLRQYWGTEANLINFAGLKGSARDLSRMVAGEFSKYSSITQPTYAFVRGNEYFGTVYDKGSLALETIDNLMGDSLSSEFWKEYFETYKFKHPTPDNFRQLLSERAGDDITGVFDYIFYKTEPIDLSVSGLYNERIDSATSEINFVLSKEGDFDYPIEYRVYLANGDSLSGVWDPVYHRKEISLTAESPALSVIIDPDNKFAVDLNLLNNSMEVNPDNRPGFRLSAGLMFLIESLLSYLGGI